MYFVQIFKVLHQSKKVDRQYINGSKGKKTTIFDFDIDMVLLINDEEPPFDDVLEKFEMLIRESEYFSKMRNFKKSDISIQFTIDQFDFDVLPAPNFLTRDSDRDDARKRQQQQRRTLDRIKRDPVRYGCMYSGGLAEASIDFMRRQDDFTLDMVRLAKFWFKSLFLGHRHVSDGKLLIELVAVYAAQKEAVFQPKSHLRCFTAFMGLLQNFESLDVVFNGEYIFPEHQVTDNNRPRVMDPTNPYDNLANNWSTTAKEQIIAYANGTLQQLQDMCAEGKVDFDILFDLKGFPRAPPLMKKVMFLYGLGKSSPSMPVVTIRNDTKLNRPANDLFLKANLLCFQNKLNSTLVSDANDLKDIERNVTKAFNIHIRGREYQSWAVKPLQHHDYDVTIHLPIANKEESVKLSFNMF